MSKGTRLALEEARITLEQAGETLQKVDEMMGVVLRYMKWMQRFNSIRVDFGDEAALEWFDAETPGLVAELKPLLEKLRF